MTKQLQSLLIPLIAISYFFATRRGIRFLFSKRFAIFWRVGLLVVSPWLIYMTLRFGPDFWQSHFLFSGITRTISPIEGHVEGYLYYFSHLINYENLFWVLLLPLAAGLCTFNAFVRRSKGDTLILAWITIVLVVFTFAQTKLFWYILPAFPAFAIALSSLLFQLMTKIPLLIRYIFESVDQIVEIFKITAIIREIFLKLPIVKNIRLRFSRISKFSQRTSLISLLPPTENRG
jgi:4-amino-4-deoxy-L-arabinose transferase-like glycosyltransferase